MIEYSEDNNQWIKLDNPSKNVEIKINYTEEGVHTFYIKDEIGNIKQIEIQTTKLDKTPPMISINTNDYILNQENYITGLITDNQNMNSEATYTQTVYIYAGDLKYVENDNELAAVVAHEIGHLVNGHTAKSSIFDSLLSSFNPNTKTENGSATVGLIKTISSNKVNKDNEKEADITAVDLLMTSGYNPLALISVVYKSDFTEAGGLLDSNLSCEERIMNIYDYANYNYPEKVKANYKTDSYQSALNLIYANLKIRKADSKKMEKAQKEQEKLQKEKLKRARNMAKSTNPWSSAYSLMQVSGN